ncbi:hypothetical protein RvY_01675, partial [Ramazzottius varieornatus]
MSDQRDVQVVYRSRSVAFIMWSVIRCSQIVKSIAREPSEQPSCSISFKSPANLLPVQPAVFVCLLSARHWLFRYSLLRSSFCRLRFPFRFH